MKKYNSILITGGTGSFGNAMVSRLLKNYSQIKRLVIFSRDELKQLDMMRVFNQSDYPQLRYYLGNVRDRSRLQSAFECINSVIHAAALKQVLGSENIVQNLNRLVSFS